MTHLLELLNEAAVLQVSLESLDGSGAIREASDRREALHGEVEGVTVFIGGSEKRWEPQGAHTQTGVRIYTHTHTHIHVKGDTT